MRIVLAWLGLIPVMIGNGIARESLYGPSMRELRAHQVSTGSGVLLLVVYCWLVVPWLRLDSAREAWGVGGLWLALTVVFEFGFGYYVAGHSWSRLFLDYNLLEGRVWSLFLIAVLVVPWAVFELKR